MNFYDTYVMYCSRVGKTPSGVAREIGISKSIVSRWKNGGGKPTDSTIQKIADYFGVPVSVMRGNENKKTTTENSGGFSEKDVRLVAWFNSLPEEKQKAILSLGGAPEDLAE